MSKNMQKQKQKKASKSWRKRKNRKQQELPKAFQSERFQAKHASSSRFNAPSIFIHHINRKPKPKVFLTTLQKPMLRIHFQVRISPIHQIPLKPNLVLCRPSYGMELEVSQREQRELHRHHSSTRSNLI